MDNLLNMSDCFSLLYISLCLEGQPPNSSRTTGQTNYSPGLSLSVFSVELPERTISFLLKLPVLLDLSSI